MERINDMTKILELKSNDEWLKAFPVMNQLRTDLTKDSYIDLLTEMRKQGYRLFALYEEDKIVCVAGVTFKVNFYNKRHLYIYDLVTDSSYRSKGYGHKLLEFIHQWAKDNGAEYVALESATQRTDAHRFYEDNFNYDKWCYSFRKQL